MNPQTVLTSLRNSINRYDDAWIPLLRELLHNLSCIKYAKLSETIDPVLSNVRQNNHDPLSNGFVETFMSLTLKPHKDTDGMCVVTYLTEQSSNSNRLFILDRTFDFPALIQSNFDVILGLFKARQITIRKITEIKLALNKPPLDNRHWEQILQKNKKKAETIGIDGFFFSELFRGLHEESLSYQRRLISQTHAGIP